MGSFHRSLVPTCSDQHILPSVVIDIPKTHAMSLSHSVEVLGKQPGNQLPGFFCFLPFRNAPDDQWVGESPAVRDPLRSTVTIDVTHHREFVG